MENLTQREWEILHDSLSEYYTQIHDDPFLEDYDRKERLSDIETLQKKLA